MEKRQVSLTDYVSIEKRANGNGYTGENFRIERSSVRNRTLYFITFTVSADIEGEAVEAGDRTELFSGCHFRANGKEYTFLIR